MLSDRAPRSRSGRISTRLLTVLTTLSLSERRKKTLLEGLSFETSLESRHGRRSRMKFRPLHDRVVVRRIDAEEKTVGGIIIPDTAREKPQQGEVIAVGPGARDESGKLVPLDVRKGDRVLFGKWSGTEVKIDGEELLIMKESDIMGVLETAQRARSAA